MKPTRSTTRTLEVFVTAEGTPWSCFAAVRMSPGSDEPKVCDMGDYTVYAFGAARKVRALDVPAIMWLKFVAGAQVEYLGATVGAEGEEATR